MRRAKQELEDAARDKEAALLRLEASKNADIAHLQGQLDKKQEEIDILNEFKVEYLAQLEVLKQQLGEKDAALQFQVGGVFFLFFFYFFGRRRREKRDRVEGRDRVKGRNRKRYKKTKSWKRKSLKHTHTHIHIDIKTSMCSICTSHTHTLDKHNFIF